MKKILFLSRSLGVGGAEKRMVTVARLLKKRGYEVNLVSYSGNRFFAEELEKENISVVWLSKGNFCKKLLQVRNLIKSNQYQAVISFLPTLNIINCLASIGISCRVIIGESSASSKFEQFMGRSYVIRGYLEDVLAYLFANFIVANSDNARGLRTQRSKWLSNKIITIHNPVLVPTPTDEYVFKKNGKLNIVVAASIQPIKNPLMVVKAISELAPQYRSQLQIDWYGSVIDENLNQQILYEIRKNSLEGVLNFHEATNKIGEIMTRADVVALFSVAEGLPNAICEGMMLGKPIIMTRISDYKQMVDDTNGFLCDSDHLQSINSAIVDAVKCSEDRLMAMGRKSKEVAERLFSPEMIGDKWQELIK